MPGAALVICKCSKYFLQIHTNLVSRAIQYAKALGLKVLAIDGGAEKISLCTKLGADAAIDFTKTQVTRPRYFGGNGHENLRKIT